MAYNKRYNPDALPAHAEPDQARKIIHNPHGHRLISHLRLRKCSAVRHHKLHHEHPPVPTRAATDRLLHPRSPLLQATNLKCHPVTTAMAATAPQLATTPAAPQHKARPSTATALHPQERTKAVPTPPTPRPAVTAPAAAVHPILP